MRALARRLPGVLRRPLGDMYRLARRVLRAVNRRIDRFVEATAARLPQSRTLGIPDRLLADKRAALARKRTYGERDLERLADLLCTADDVLPVREAWARRDDWGERMIALRHDMDHDLENAVRFAEWEAARGWRSTYYVLHSDWYWGDAPDGSPSPFVLQALDRIASLGHEIGVHNNALTVALRTGQDPVRVLDRVLSALRRHGFEITGTVAHGDPLCHVVGYVNYEMFTDCPAPQLGPPDRLLEWNDPSTRTTRQLQLAPVPMADLGLDHEANAIGHTLYLSDTGGKWNVPYAGIDDQFRREGGYLQVLAHPVWWALSGEAFSPRPTVIEATPDEIAAAAAGDPTAEPMRIVVRGDCCSRRAINMNRDLFGGNPVMVRDEKARTDFFLDHLSVGSPTTDDIRRYLDVDSMTGSLRHYALGQVERATLGETAGRLLVMDNYADMNFAAWRHRKLGWKLWIHARHLRDREAFEREFEPVGQLSLEESLEIHIRLIEQYRAANGDIPVLYLNQPIAYYSRLAPRGEFRRLGLELERAVPKVYLGDVHDAELEPDDMGSSGPGQTLHFTGPTYRKMIQVALEKGLADWLPARTTPN